MATIVDINGKRRLSLGKEEFARSFNFGGKWSHLTIGIRWSVLTGVNVAAQNSSANNRWRLGICNGNTRTFNSYDTVYWAGVNPNTFNTSTAWTYSAGGGSPYLEAYNADCNREYRTGNTTTNVGLVNLTNAVRLGCYDGTGDTMAMMFLGVVKYSGNLYIYFGYPSQAQVQANYGADEYTWLSAVETFASGITSGLTTNAAVGSPSVSGVPSENSLGFDTASFVWHWDAYPALIRDFVVVRAS